MSIDQKIDYAKTLVQQNPSSIFRDINGEAVLLTPEDYTVHSLNGLGTRIWQLSQVPMTIDGIVTVLLEEYSVEPEILRTDVSRFIDEMVQKGLMQALTSEE